MINSPFPLITGIKITSQISKLSWNGVLRDVLFCYKVSQSYENKTSRNDCDKKAREFCLNNCKNNFVKQRLEGEHVPDIPLLRYGIALALLSITPAISKWAQCSASTNSCEGWEKVQSSPTIIYPYQRTKTKENGQKHPHLKLPCNDNKKTSR